MINKLFHKLSGVPWVFGSLLDGSEEVYAIAYKDVDKKLGLRNMIRKNFESKTVTIQKDNALRVYYIFVGSNVD